MSRIGIFLDMFPAGGGAFQYGQLILEACQEISKKNKTEIVVLYTKIEWAKYLQNTEVSSHYIAANRLQHLIRRVIFKLKVPIKVWQKLSYFVWPYSKVMKQKNCDIWLFPSQDRWGYEAGVPFIGTIHDLMHRYETFPELVANGEGKSRDFLYSNICKYAQKILVDSDLGQKHVRDCYNVERDKVRVQRFTVPNYILKHSEIDVVKKYNLPEKYLFYPAQFWAHKNHLNLIKSIGDLKEQVPDIKLVFSGAKEKEYDEYKKYVEDNGLQKYVYFIGYVPDSHMASLYKKSCGMVMGSCCGPTNIPQLESLFLDVPTAVADVYASREQLGGAALYFNPRDIDSISHIMKQLWNNDNLPNNYAQIRDKYSKVIFKDSLIKVIEECL